jgi:hypothetical protein
MLDKGARFLQCFIAMKTTSLPLKHSMNSVRRQLALLLVPVAIACFALSPQARAVNPPPDGDYPNQNTAEGENSLFSLRSGFGNTATGYHALFSLRTGNFNTANGAVTLVNTTADSNTGHRP